MQLLRRGLGRNLQNCLFTQSDNYQPTVSQRRKESIAGKSFCPVLSCSWTSLRASSPIWASETSLARTRERAAKPRSRVLARLASLAQIGELARRLFLDILGGLS